MFKALSVAAIACVIIPGCSAPEVKNAKATRLHVKLINQQAGNEVVITDARKRNDTIFTLAQIIKPKAIVSQFTGPISDTRIVPYGSEHVGYYILGDKTVFRPPADVDNYHFIDSLSYYRDVTQGAKQLYKEEIPE
ncbi:MAG: hypothetical protein GF398_10905 [Chitinivibrionales bacterium]|nr:hypothetical protein [Chitinivibrionales bacterium]